MNNGRRPKNGVGIACKVASTEALEDTVDLLRFSFKVQSLAEFSAGAKERQKIVK